MDKRENYTELRDHDGNLFLIQQCKVDNKFKIYLMKNGYGGPVLTPVGFDGLGTAFPELAKFEVRKGTNLVYKSNNTSLNGAPVDIVAGLQKISKDVTVLFSNNYCCGQLENVTDLPKEYSYSVR